MLGADAEYRKYENAVKAALETFVREQLPKARATVYDSRLYEGKSGLQHQIDVSVDGTLGGIRIFIIGECKCYRRRVGKRDVTAFCSIKNDLEPDFAFMFTTEGFDSGAKIFAQANNVSLILQPKESVREAWEIVIPTAAILAVLPRQSASAAPLKEAPQASAGGPTEGRARNSESTTSKVAPANEKSQRKGVSSEMQGAYGITGAGASKSQLLYEKPDMRNARTSRGRRRVEAEALNADVSDLRDELSGSDPGRRLRAVDVLGSVLSRALRRIFTFTRRSYTRKEVTGGFSELNSILQSAKSAGQALFSVLSDADEAIKTKAIGVVADALQYGDLDSLSGYRFDSLLGIERLAPGLSRTEKSELRSELFELSSLIRSAILRVVESLTDVNAHVQMVAASAILLVYKDLPKYRDRTFHDREMRFSPDSLEPTVMAKIEQLTASNDQPIKGAAVIVMCGLRDTRIVETLAPLLDDKGLTHRPAIAHALGRLHFDLEKPKDVERIDKVGTALAKCLSDRDVAVRRESAAALRAQKCPIAREALAAVLDDEDKTVGSNAALALSELHDDRCVPALIRIVQNPETISDYDYVEALGSIRSAKAIPALTKKVRAARFDYERSRYLKAIERIDKRQAARLAKGLPPLEPSYDGSASPNRPDTTPEGILSRILGGMGLLLAVLQSKFEGKQRPDSSRRDFLVPMRWFRRKEIEANEPKGENPTT